MDTQATPEEKIGMAWWNNMSKPERSEALRNAKRVLGREDVSASDAYDVWRGCVPANSPRSSGADGELIGGSAPGAKAPGACATGCCGWRRDEPPRDRVIMVCAHVTWRDEARGCAGADPVRGAIFFDETSTVPDWMWASSGMAVRRCITDALVINWWIDLPECLRMSCDDVRADICYAESLEMEASQ